MTWMIFKAANEKLLDNEEIARRMIERGFSDLYGVLISEVSNASRLVGFP